MVARHHTPRLVAVLLLVAATLAGAAHAADSLSEGGAALEHHQVQVLVCAMNAPRTLARS